MRWFGDSVKKQMSIEDSTPPILRKQTRKLDGGSVEGEKTVHR